mmetsp:Transcript_2472/g.6609  ORF Transcript_2472/g.6609 Transcript_2472/m.6609 type:complete len:101 (-) Transcript_2472:921-1223(-)
MVRCDDVRISCGLLMHLRLQAGGHQSMTFSKDSAHTGVALLHATLLRLCSHGHADWMHGCSTWKRLFWRRNMLCCQRPCTPATPAIVQVPGNFSSYMTVC